MATSLAKGLPTFVNYNLFPKSYPFQQLPELRCGLANANFHNQPPYFWFELRFSSTRFSAASTVA